MGIPQEKLDERFDISPQRKVDVGKKLISGILGPSCYYPKKSKKLRVSTFQ